MYYIQSDWKIIYFVVVFDNFFSLTLSLTEGFCHPIKTCSLIYKNEIQDIKLLILINTSFKLLKLWFIDYRQWHI